MCVGGFHRKHMIVPFCLAACSGARAPYFTKAY